MRRYGEQALKDDIRDLLRSWGTYLSSCGLIIINAPKTSRGTFFEEEKGIIDRDDLRIRFVPFMTDRPTLDVVKEIHRKCSSVYVNVVRADPALATAAGVDCKPNAISLSLVADSLPDQTERDVAVRLAEMTPEDILIRRPESDELFRILKQFEEVATTEDTRSSTLLSDLKSCINTIKAVYGSQPDDQTDYSSPIAGAPTLGRDISLNLTSQDVINLPSNAEDFKTALHIAAELGSARIISMLLDAGANPTRRDVRGRTAYFLCKSKDSRDAFRRRVCLDICINSPSITGHLLADFELLLRTYLTGQLLVFLMR